MKTRNSMVQVGSGKSTLSSRQNHPKSQTSSYPILSVKGRKGQSGSPFKGVFGFTLVELIIVITILAILATIAFMSFQGYMKQSRDAVRVSDLASASKGLSIFFTKSGVYPEAENPVTITASGNTLSSQGTLGESVVRAINMNQVPLDPVDQTKYFYSTNTQKTKYQLLTFTENTNLASFQTQAYASLDDRGVKLVGDDIGFVLNQDNSQLDYSVDVYTTTGTYIAYVNRNLTLKGTGSVLADLKDLDYFKKKIELETTAHNYTLLILYQGVTINGTYYITHLLEDYYKSKGFNVIVDTGATTLEKVQAYNPDFIGCDLNAWSCSNTFLNTLYDHKYNIVSIGNDSRQGIYPIQSGTGVGSQPASTTIPINTFSFMGRGWSSISFGSDTRRKVEDIHSGALILARDNTLNSPAIFYLEEPRKGKWLHFQIHTLNDELLQRANAYMLK